MNVEENIIAAAITYIQKETQQDADKRAPAYSALFAAVLKLPLAHTCPRCHVEPGEYCQFGGGVIDTTSHSQRQVMADAS